MEVKLQAYEGPLDLLLQLIAKNEINIYDIPIAQLTDQYLEAIKELPRAPRRDEMERVSEFLVMAATLLEIKSRMLLPRPPKAVEEEDPRDALVRRLLEYKKCQSVADALRALPSPGERLAGGGEELPFPEPAPETLDGVSLAGLWYAFSEIMRRCERKIDHSRAGYGDMPRERFTVAEKVSQIIERLRGAAGFSLSELFKECVSRGEMVVTFIALLEAIRMGLVLVKQRGVFNEVTCEACANG